MPAVSVIIPVYNGARYIGEAIESVLGQTFSDQEIIVVDDGSTDDTRQSLEPYVASRKIRYFCQENGGPAKARNCGIRRASGRYIAFLDSDDVWHPEKTESQMRLLETRRDLKAVHGDIEILQDGVLTRGAPGGDRLVREGRIFEPYLVLRSWVFLSTMMVERDLLEEVGGFNESLHTAEDTNLVLRIAHDHDFGFVDRVVTLRRLHDANLSSLGGERLGTFRNLDDLVRLFPELHPSRYPLMRRAYECRYQMLGCSYFRHNNMGRAREFLGNALKWRFYNPKTVSYYAATFVPGNVIGMARRVKAAGRRALGRGDAAWQAR